MAALFESPEFEHVIDQSREPLGLLSDDLKILLPFFPPFDPILREQLRIHSDGHKRSLKFVRDVGNKRDALRRFLFTSPGFAQQQTATQDDRDDQHGDQYHAKQKQGMIRWP